MISDRDTIDQLKQTLAQSGVDVALVGGLDEVMTLLEAAQAAGHPTLSSFLRPKQADDKRL